MANKEELDSIKVGVSEPLPIVEPGLYPVVISNIKKKEAKKWQSEEMETVIQFEFSIDDEQRVFKTVRPKLSISPNPSNLYKIWAAVLGKNPVLEGEEADEFHLSDMLGKNIRVMIETTEKNGKKYNNLASFLPYKGDLPKEKEVEQEPEE